MKVFIKSIFPTAAMAAVIFLASSVFAHEIKLYHEQRVNVGESVRIEFGLGHFPASFDHEHGFFRQVGASKLVILDPKGVVIPLDYELQNDRYVAEFIPVEEGLYWVINHSPRGVVDRTGSNPPAGMQLRFYDAKAPLVVGDLKRPYPWPTFLHVELQGSDDVPDRVGDVFSGRVVYKGKAIANQSVLLVSPTERAREVISDADGRIEVDLNEPGTWMIKTTLMDEARSGTYGGIDYDRVRYNSAMYLQIRKN